MQPNPVVLRKWLSAVCYIVLTAELARSVIRQAGQLYGYTDDMTVLAVRVEERR